MQNNTKKGLFNSYFKSARGAYYAEYGNHHDRHGFLLSDHVLARVTIDRTGSKRFVKRWQPGKSKSMGQTTFITSKVNYLPLLCQKLYIYVIPPHFPY